MAGFKENYEERLKCHPSVNTQGRYLTYALMKKHAERVATLRNEENFNDFYASLDLPRNIPSAANQEDFLREQVRICLGFEQARGWPADASVPQLKNGLTCPQFRQGSGNAPAD